MTENNQGLIGRFVWNTTTDDWSWDAGLYELHGYQVDAVLVDMDLLLSHKQGEHRALTVDVLGALAGADRRFSNFHRIIDANGRQRTVLTVGESRIEEAEPSPVRMCRGFMVDVTQDEFDSTRLAVRRARQSTAAIQQSMGLLMGSIGLTEDAAFAFLRRVSSHHNVKVRDLARRFLRDAASTADGTPRNVSQLLVAAAADLAEELASTRPE